MMCSDLDHNHNIDWAKQNELHKQWLIDNPDSQYLGWMSI